MNLILIYYQQILIAVFLLLILGFFCSWSRGVVAEFVLLLLTIFTITVWGAIIVDTWKHNETELLFMLFLSYMEFTFLFIGPLFCAAYKKSGLNNFKNLSNKKGLRFTIMIGWTLGLFLGLLSLVFVPELKFPIFLELGFERTCVIVFVGTLTITFISTTAIGWKKEFEKEET